MSGDETEGQWKQPGGQLKARRGKLTDDAPGTADGNVACSGDRFRERCGSTRDEARRRLRHFGTRSRRADPTT